MPVVRSESEPASIPLNTTKSISSSTFKPAFLLQRRERAISAEQPGVTMPRSRWHCHSLCVRTRGRRASIAVPSYWKSTLRIARNSGWEPNISESRCHFGPLVAREVRQVPRAEGLQNLNRSPVLGTQDSRIACWIASRFQRDHCNHVANRAGSRWSFARFERRKGRVSGALRIVRNPQQRFPVCASSSRRFPK